MPAKAAVLGRGNVDGCRRFETGVIGNEMPGAGARMDDYIEDYQQGTDEFRDFWARNLGDGWGREVYGRQ